MNPTTLPLPTQSIDLASPPTSPLKCPRCGTEFFPNGSGEYSLTSCPKCQRQGTANTFLQAEAKRFEDLIHPEFTHEQRVQRKKQANRQSQLNFMMLGGVVVLGAVLTAGYMLMKKKRGKQQQLVAQTASQTDSASAYEVAKQLLAHRPTKLPAELVRDADRIKPLWDWYYAQPESALGPWTAQAYVSPVLYETRGKQAMAMSVFARGQEFDLLLEGTSSGWKLDWEAFSGVHGGRWEVYLKQIRGFGPEGDYCVHVEIMPDALIMPSFRVEHQDLNHSETKVLKFFAAERERSFAVAVIPATMPIAEKFALITPGAPPVRIVAKLKMLNAASYPPEVEPLAVLQKGWDQLDPPPQTRQ